MEKVTSQSHLFKARRWFPQLFQHGPAYSGLTNVRIILPRVLLSSGRPPRSLVPRLVEVGLVDENERLD